MSQSRENAAFVGGLFKQSGNWMKFKLDFNPKKKIIKKINNL